MCAVAHFTYLSLQYVTLTTHNDSIFRLENGAYYAQNNSPAEYKYGGTTAETVATLPLDEASDDEVAAKLWEISVKLVGL